MDGDARFEAAVRSLTRPEAWGAPPHAAVELRRTHLSAVFLVGERVYKIKRPVDLGFVDFTTLARRAAACEAEVRLNRRLAPGIYLGRVPLVAAGEGLRLDRGAAPEQVAEWAVEMVRLNDEDTLAAALERGSVDPEVLTDLALRLQRMYQRADRGAHISRWATAAAVGKNARDNFLQTRAHCGQTVHPAVHRALRQATDEALARLGPRFDARAARSIPCDTHGDLRAEHVYLLPTGTVVLDCIEFSDRLRYADPISDLAFLLMDLEIHGHRELAGHLQRIWIQRTGDAEARHLLPFYKAYRSVVRAKVEGMALDVQGAGDRERAQKHWLYALSTLSPPATRPTLLGIGGLPGTGKSTLARGLAEAAGFVVLRSDVLRKERGAVEPAAWGQGAYHPDARDRVYDALFARAEALLRRGERVILDASFARERWRQGALALADRLGVPGALLRCEAPDAVAHERLLARRGDPSDADVQVHIEASRSYEPPGPASRDRTWTLDAQGSPEAVRARALARLERLGLVGAPTPVP